MSAVRTRMLPLFPLSNVVLFPQTRVPLHIFERRYRQMMADSLERDRMIGMVTVLPEQVGEMSGDPAIFAIGCAGFVEEHRRLADGRYDLILYGTQRFRVLREELPDGSRLYRVAEGELLDESPETEPDRLSALRQTVVESLEQLVGGAIDAPDSELLSERLGSLDHAAFTNALCAAVALPAVEKQGLLEATGVVERLERLEGLLQFHLASPLPRGSRVLH